METVRRGAPESIVFGLKSTKKSTKVVKKRRLICSGTGGREFAFSAKSASSSLVSGKRENIRLWRKSRQRICETASSPTARKYSLLFGGAYAPNDAIYRKRYAFTEIIMPYNFYFLRARRRKQLSTVSYSLTRHFDQKDHF